MVAIKVPVDKQRVHVPVKKQGRFTVDRGLVKMQYRFVKFNDMPSLWPFNYMREETKKACQQFIHAMQLKGMDLLTNESDILVIGPYVHRKWDGVQFAHGRSTGEDQYQDLADFVLEAMFINHKMHLVEHYIDDSQS